MPIEIIKADITTLKVDAVVNAANNSLRGGGGVDGAIHRAAGPKLLEACRKFDGCATGATVITPAFNLPAKHIFHTVGPVWRGGQYGEALLLESCYTSCFDIAEALELKSIAFPAISCGVYGYPMEEAARIAVSLAQAWLADYDCKVIFALFDDAALHTYSTILKGL